MGHFHSDKFGVKMIKKTKKLFYTHTEMGVAILLFFFLFSPMFYAKTPEDHL